MNDQKTENDRRSFLVKLSLGISALSAAVAGIPVVSALLAPLLKKTPEVWRNVGSLNDFPPGTTKLVQFENADPSAWAGETARTAAWLQRGADRQFTAFAANCTHLGCPVRWEAGAGLFMCPCHGGVYYKDGTVAAGPPPKPLNKYQVRISKGQVQVLTGPLPVTAAGI